MNAAAEVISLDVFNQPFGYSVVSPELDGLCLMEQDAQHLVQRLVHELQTIYLLEHRRHVEFEVVETTRCGIIPTKLRVSDID